MAVKERKLSGATFQKYLQKYLDYYKRNVNEFLENSTIHGLRYFNQRNLSILERTFFIVTFAGIVAASILFVSFVNEKWSTSPTIISISNEPAFIVQEPFPSLTICNMNQALKSRVANFSKNSKEHELMQLVCGVKPNLTVLDSIKDWRIATEFILSISQPCERMLLQCSFGGIEYNCTDLFHPVIMDEGLCCTFNSLDPVYKFTNISNQFNFNISYPLHVKPVDYNLENGYRNPLPKYYSPMKALGFGQSVGLNLLLNVESDDYYCSSSKSIGLKLAIHNPEDEPNIYENGLLLPPGQESYVRILPTQLSADKKLRNLSRKYRNCIFEEESKLKVFSHYSYENCMYECRTKMTIFHCGCIAIYMVSRYSNWTVCSHKDLPCIYRVNHLLVYNGSDHVCGRECWSNCFSKSFKVDIFSAKLKKSFMETISPIISNMSSVYVDQNIALAKFYMKRYTYENAIQSPYIDAIDVLASVGGLIGVFMGFSFISLTEIIYYMCIRSKRSQCDQDNKLSLRKPCVPLAKRSRMTFLNPYKSSTNSPQSLNILAAKRKFGISLISSTQRYTTKKLSKK